MTDTVIVACPACNTLNRAPREKLAAGASGKCGSCGAPLFAGHPVALSARRFGTHAAKSDTRAAHPMARRACGGVRLPRHSGKHPDRRRKARPKRPESQIERRFNPGP